jgi:hypothetical protein
MRILEEKLSRVKGFFARREVIIEVKRAFPMRCVVVFGPAI